MMAEPEQPFDAPWQARAFALVLDLHQRGVFSWSDWTQALASEISDRPDRAYYESWLAALQNITGELGLIDAIEIQAMQEAWLAAAARTPHGHPIVLHT